MTIAERRLPISAPNDGYYVLHYSLDRPSILFHHSSAAASFFYPFLLILFVIGILLTPFSVNLLGPYFFFVVLPLIAASLLFLDLSKPTNIEVSPSGFRIFWLNPVFFWKSPEITWDCMCSVSYSDDSGSHALDSRIYQLQLNIAKFDEWQRFFLETMCVTITQSYALDNLTIRLIESGFFHESDQDIFRSALLKYVPEELIDTQLAARVEFGEVPTYTALWLSSLHGSLKVPSVLPDGTKLADGRYEVMSRLASGGQGNVYDANYRAENLGDTATERCVLKEFVLPERGGTEILKRAVQNIQREANLLQSLDHPQIVSYRDLFIEGPRAYLVMERIEGRTLRQFIETNGAATSEQVRKLGVQMCDLIEYLHSQVPAVIHRDFTPENLMLTKDDRLMLIDFNVAYRLESNSVKTVVGKYAYVPPEQFRGKPTTQSDIYAMGATLFYLLTAVDPEPLSKSDPSELVPNLDKDLASLIARCTEPDTASRYLNIQEVRTELDNILRRG
jgi:predicted Ser/Thr protein kinase